MRLILLIISLLFFYSCKEESTPNGFYKIQYESNIKENIVYKTLNDSLEHNFRYSEIDNPNKNSRSTNVKIEINNQDTISVLTKLKANSFFSSEYYFDNKGKFQNRNTDTLLFLIDNFDGYSAKGLRIQKIKDFYKIEYKVSSDLQLPGEIKQTTYYNRSELKLDKRKYKINDSVYGYINVDLIHKDNLGNHLKIKSKGYFRSKIKKSIE
ncbi:MULTISPECIES: hypothetical protein [Elizabethkingia]|uniref:hypothetical protein n=1 Tax=Elizabethkingia TaxID=308865 RepID=UPI0020A1BF8F|nr:hypothetical protein [Elizabethkingia sp. S0634]MCP1252133.1 hypothetical protein [Elizabethkingia sp. S0634]